MKLDKIEVGILEELQKNARLSFRELGERLDVSTPTVSSKIERLEEMGLIQGYHAKLDPRKIGLNTYLFQIEVEHSVMDQTVETLSSMEEVTSIYEIDKTSLALFAHLPDLSELDILLEKLRECRGAIDFEFGRVTRDLKDSMELPLSEHPSLAIECYYCGKPIEGQPVKVHLDDREHYLCCDACADLYKDKYRRLKDKADV